MSIATTSDNLKDELSKMDGKPFDGARSIIFFPFATPTKYLSGLPYLFSYFPERAYELGENTAKQLIEDYPGVLAGATILKIQP